MRTLNEPSSQGGNAATGLIFVGVVLAVLFAAGIAAVVAARPGQQPGTAAPAPVSATPAGGGEASLGREAANRLVELVSLRDTAIGRRDPALLARVYEPGCVNRRYDLASINQLRAGHVRWLGLRSTVKVLAATQTGERRWTLVAAVSRAAARLVTDGGRQVRAVPAQRQVLRFTMLRLPDGRNWVLLGIATGST